MEEKKGKSRSNQKLKLMYLYRILLENTDEEHGITVKEIIDKLDGYNVTAERKSIYDDIESLRQMGVDIDKIQKDRTYSYKITNRDFSLPELKLLVDSVQSAKFITEEKSKELIHKIEHLASNYEARQLDRQVFVQGRVKSMNEDIFKNVDLIYQAIAGDVKVRYQYLQWVGNKKLEPKKNGEFYEISPWGLSWDDENYYMIGFDSEEKKLKHYRVDKMQKVSISDKKREGNDNNKNIDIAEYAKKHFGMFDGEEKRVTILCKNEKLGVLIDRFGDDIMIQKADNENSRAIVKVAVSRHFLGWIIALGPDFRIISPDPVVEMMKEEIKRLTKQYE